MTSLLPRKTCNKCGIEKSELDDFPPNQRKLGYFLNTCKACENARKSERAKEKRALARAESESSIDMNFEPVGVFRDPKYDWYWKQVDAEKEKKRRRRARKYAVAHEPYSEADVLEKWGTCCHLCGEEVDLNAPRSVGVVGWERGLHLEHVVDLALGGSDTLDNVKPSHGKCNLRKPKK